MDNTTILFNAIQRAYRNAIVDLIRCRMTEEFGEQGIAEVRNVFQKKIEFSDGSIKTLWELVKSAAEERRSGGTGELSTPIRDEYELLGVEYFFNVFEKHFAVLCANYAGKPRKEINQARQVLITWMKQIKNVRDPVSHPVTDDIDFQDSTQVLYCARKVLDFCGLPEAASQIVRLQSTLLGGVSGEEVKTFAVLPPADEVVMEFVGRHNEIASLNRWFSENRTSRWSLSGEGGKGKSAIAFAFANGVSTRDDHDLDAVIWLSAKRRRFIEGQTILVDRPDFVDKASAVNCIIRSLGGTPTEDANENESTAINLLTDFPTLMIVDDIDTVEDEGEDAIQFLVMTVPEKTPTRVLITSRRAMFGMANLTTQVEGLTSADGEEFIRSRCDLMGIQMAPALELKDRVLEVTDSSPLYVEDLLRLTQAGLEIKKAVGLWAEKRGDEARKYAIQREYDQLNQDAKTVLLALAIQGPSKSDDVCAGLDWRTERLLDSLQQLRKMFLMPNLEGVSGQQVLALNNNVRRLVLSVFRDTEAYRRTERLMKAATGGLKTKQSEDSRAESAMRRARLLVSQYKNDEAEQTIREAIDKFPGRSDLYATLAWINRKSDDFASARDHFKRAHELGLQDRDSYWHWSEMESQNEEWNASAEAARKGLDKFQDQGLMFRLGYALHRQGKELASEGDIQGGAKLCKEAQSILTKAIETRTSESRNYTLRKQLYRAIALNLEALDDGRALAIHIAAWHQEYPDDTYFIREYERLRQKYPQFLRER